MCLLSQWDVFARAKPAWVSLNHISKPFWLWDQFIRSQADISVPATGSRCYRWSWFSVLSSLHMAGFSLGYNRLLNLSLPRTLNLHYNKIFPARDPQRRGRGGIMLSVHPGGYYICDLGTGRHRGSSSTVGLDIEKKSCNLFWNWRDFILFWKPSR